LENIFEVML